MPPREPLLPLVSLVLVVMLGLALIYAVPVREVRHRDKRIEAKVDKLVRAERQDRYLLCVLVDASGADALPQPCLDKYGNAINRAVTPP